MAFSKNEYNENKLTQRQEKFVDELLSGKSQRQAYYIAYPNSKKWKDNTVDSRASVLVKNKKVAKRLEQYNKIKANKIAWTRDRALEEINWIMDINKQDLIRIMETYDKELEEKEKELQEWVNLLGVENIDTNGVQKHIKKTMTEITMLKKQRRVNSTNTKGIFEGAKILNRMFGLDITKVEIKDNDTSREAAKQLSVEELKALAYATKKGEID